MSTVNHRWLPEVSFDLQGVRLKLPTSLQSGLVISNLIPPGPTQSGPVIILKIGLR